MSQDNHEREACNPEMKKLGAQLKALREAQGLSFEDVASGTHVRPHVIKSIESGTIEETVAPVYVRGFIKTYCEYLMASDLWRKYSLGIPSGDDSGEVNPEETEERIEIKHPVPMFRRSSIIWVYIILVVAVLGAAYLLWSQSRQPGGTETVFPLNPTVASTDVTETTAAVSGDKNISDDRVIIIPPLVSGDAVPPIAVPQSPDTSVSRDRRAVVSGDLSWMNETSAHANPVVELPQFVDRTLLIEITGSNNKLSVERGGKVLTRRTLGIGGRRSYDVTSDTKLTASAGNKARVTWVGRRYDSIGSDNTAISILFHPDGSVTLVSGKSPHFASNVPSENE